MNDLLELQVPDALVLNRAANRVAYHTHTRWNNHPHGRYPTSSLWVADVGKEKSARRLTDGEAYHDHSPQWSPDGKCIFFISNRRTKKKTKNNRYSIYYIDVDLVLSGTAVDVRDDLFPDPDDVFRYMQNLDVLEQYNKTRPPDFHHPLDMISIDPNDRPADTLREVPNAKDCRTIAKLFVCPQPSRPWSILAFLGEFGHNTDDDLDSDGPSVRLGARLGARLRHLGKGCAGFSAVAGNNLYYATTLINRMDPRVCREGYLVDMAWSDDGQRTVVVTRPSADPDSAERHGSTFWMETAFSDDFPEKLLHVPLAIEPGSLAWVGPHVYFLSWGVAGDASSGLAVYRLQADQCDKDSACTKVDVYGDAACCPRSLKAVGGDWVNDNNGSNVNENKDNNGDVIVHIQHGTEEKLVLAGANRTLFASEKAILDYAAAMTRTGQGGRGGGDVSNTVLVVVQGSMDHPSEVFSVDSATGEMVQLSDHGGAFVAQQQQGSRLGTPSWIECSVPAGKDGGRLTIDALFLAPVAGRKVGSVDHFRHGDHPPWFGRRRVDPVVSITGAPYPTVILIHDGPYSRTTNGFDRRSREPDLVELLAPLLLRAGVALLQPNYRGGSGRGSQFAARGRARDGGVGRRDVDDVLAMADAAIKQNVADPAALFVMGWSYGGYLAYLAYVAALRGDSHDLDRGWHFRGAVCGGAIVDWDSLAVTSSEGDRFANLSGAAPWKYDSDESKKAAPSPLRELTKALHGVGQGADRIPPLLVFHGEADTLVPLSQAESILRAFSIVPGGNKAKVISYPGQGHFFRSKECIEDMLERIVHFVTSPLSIQIDGLVVAQER